MWLVPTNYLTWRFKSTLASMGHTKKSSNWRQLVFKTCLLWRAWDAYAINPVRKLHNVEGCWINTCNKEQRPISCIHYNSNEVRPHRKVLIRLATSPFTTYRNLQSSSTNFSDLPIGCFPMHISLTVKLPVPELVISCKLWSLSVYKIGICLVVKGGDSWSCMITSYDSPHLLLCLLCHWWNNNNHLS